MNTTTEVAFDSGPPAQSPHKRSIVLTRTFDCPRATMWQMWTEPAHNGSASSTQSLDKPAKYLAKRI